MASVSSASAQWTRRLAGWETRRYAPGDEGDDLVAERHGEGSDADTDVEDLSPDACSVALFDMLVALKLNGTISAKTACIISFWAKRAGVRGAGAALAMSPKNSGGKWSAHFDKVVGLDEAMANETYAFDIPGHDRTTLGRTALNTHGNLVYHKLSEEIADCRDFELQLRNASSDAEWGPKLRDHPTANETTEGPVLPIGIYLDGVKFQNRDTALGMWLINLVTQRRHLLLCLRKKLMCRCGCRGWCSLFPAFQFISWLLGTLSSGRYPETRHDGTAWQEGSADADLAGSALGYKAAALIVKGDWAEFAHTFGFASWQSLEHPCFACFCKAGSGGDIDRIDGISAHALPWRQKEPADYQEACQVCEHKIHVGDAATMQRIAGALKYDKKSNGFHGRCLAKSLLDLGLQKNWRLEPSQECPDVGLIDEWCVNFPTNGVELTFWDVTAEGFARHRNPVFGPQTCLAPTHCIVDELHTMHLGVFQDFIGAAMWALINSEALDVRDAAQVTAEEHATMAVQLLRGELMQWYKRQRATNPGRPCYELQDLTVGMLGSKSKPTMKAKAGECGTMLYFSADMVEKHKDKLARGAFLVTAGRALVRYMEITRNAGLRLSEDDHKGLMACAVEFLSVREQAGICWKPKMHLMLHMLWQSAQFGNPRILGNWVDEGLNMTLASVARSSHLAVWSRRIMATFAHSAGPTAKAAKPKKKRRTR